MSAKSFASSLLKRLAPVKARKLQRSRRQASQIEILESRELLSAITVNVTHDVTAEDDEITLREAIALANADPFSPDTIHFDSGLSYDRIKVKDELVITGNTIIDASGLGAVRVSRFNYNDYLDSPQYQDFLDGNSERPQEPLHHRIFYVAPGAQAELSGLIVEGGSLQQDGSSVDLNAMQDEPFGAGIFNAGQLVMRDSAVAGNQIWGDVNFGQAIGGGAGIYNAAGADLELESTDVGELRFKTAELEAIGVDPERFEMVRDPVTNVPDPTQRVYIKRNISQGIAAGILNEGTMVVRNSSVFSNAAFYGGGGIYNAGDATFVGSKIESNVNNVWQTGGGILNSDVIRSAKTEAIASITRPTKFGGEPSLTIVDSILRDNFGWRGGAIYTENVELAISGTTFDDNHVIGASAEYSDQPFAGGGAIFVDGGDISIDGSIFTNNIAPSPGSAGPIPAGGAIFSWGDGATEIQNTTFSGNETQRGAAIYNHNRPLSLVHTTISENHATENGGALFLTAPTGVEIGGSIIAGNTIGTGQHPNIWADGLADSLGYNLIGTIASGRLNANSTDVLNEQATGLGPLGDYGGLSETYTLLPSSPALNAVPAGTFDGLEYDQRGEVRLHGPASDIGAFEAQPPATLRVDTLSDVVDGFYGPGEFSLREALLWAKALPGPDSVGFADSLVSEVLDSDNGFGVITLSSTLVLDHDVSIIGPGADVISLSGNNSHRVVQVPVNTDVTLQGITIRDGVVSGADGGGIENLGNLRLIDSVVTENEAGSDRHGGGVMNQTGSTFFMDGSTVHNNRAGNAGGGIYFRGDVTIVNSTVSNNRANQGGGFYGHTGTASITNSTITENRATLRGGAIRNWETFVTVTNSIMADNSAPTAPELFVSYSDRQISGGHNLIGIGADGFTNGVNGDIVGTAVSPRSAELGRLSDAGAPVPIHRPLPASPVIDAGKTTSLLVDQLDRKRGDESSPDIGAVEFVTQNVPDGPLVVNVDEGRSDGYYGLDQLGLDDALAIAALRPGADEIRFDESLRGAVIKSPRELVIKSDVTIIGLGADQLTIQPQARGFRVESGVDAEIRGLTIANGYHGSANSGAGGAGILNAGTLTVKDTHVKGNWNIAHIDSDDATVPGDGGGIYNSGDLTIVRTTISDSIANRGAGIFNTGDLTAVNVTLSDNLVSGNSTENGGNVFNSGIARFSNSTITDGRSNLAGATAGVYTDAGGQTTFKNTIVADNTDLSLSGVDDILTHAKGSVVSLGYNLIGEAPGFPAVSTDQLNAEPMLVPLQISNSAMPIHELLPGSPAIDNGGDGSAKDQRLRTRNKGAGPDIGAVETRLPSAGTVLVVSHLGDEVNGDYNNGDLTLREAILVSNTLAGPDTIRFSESLVEESVRASGSATIELSASWFGDVTLEVTDDVTIEVPSGSESALVALVGDGTGTLLRVSNSANVDIQKVRFTGADGNDGAIHVEDGSLVLTDSIVEANSTSGIVNSTNGVLELTGSVIRDNTSTDDGAGIRSFGDTRIHRTAVTGNRFDGIRHFTYGGGVYAGAGSLTILRSEVSHNTASIQGGGVYLTPDVTADITYTTISNNSVHLGDSVGGGVFTYSTSNVKFTNVTIAENSAVKEAGGVYVLNSITTEFTNSLIANNTANIRKDGFGSIHATHSLWRDASFDLLTDSNNQPGVDPELGPLSKNRAATRTHSLRPASPAIDAGLAGDDITDQRGRSLVDLPDVGGMLPDIGAYEVQSIGASTFQYNVYDQSQFGPGKALTYGFGFNDGSTGSSISTEPKFLGFEFDTGNLKAGHIQEKRFGTKFGGEVNADFAGKFGFDLGFFINSGSMDIGFDGEHSYLIDEAGEGATIASYIDVDDGSIYTVSPKVGAYADLVMQLDAGVSATGCWIGCSSSDLVDLDVNATIPLFSMNRQVTDFAGRPMFFAVGEVLIQDETGEYVFATNVDDVFSLSDNGTFFKITEDEDGNQSARAVEFVDFNLEPFDEPPIVPYLDGDIRYIGQGITDQVAKAVQFARDSKLVKDILDARAERNKAANDVDRLKSERAKAETARDTADTAGDRITARGEVEALGKDIERAEEKRASAEKKLKDAKDTAKKKTSFSAGLGVRFGQSEGSLLGGKADLVLGASAGSAGVGLQLGSVEVTLPDVNLRSNTPDEFGVLRASTSSFADNSELDNKRQIADLQVDFAALTAPYLGIPAGQYSLDLGPLSANLTTVSYNLGPRLNVTQDVRVEPIVEKLTYTFHEIDFEEDLVENGITYPGGYQPGAARSVRVNIDGVPYHGGNPVTSVSFDQGQEVTILDSSSPILVVPSLQMDSKVTNDIGLEVALEGSFEAFAMQLSAWGYDAINVAPLLTHQHTLGTFDLGSVFEKTFELDDPQTVTMTPFTLFETEIDGKTARTAFNAEPSGDGNEFTMSAGEYVFVRVDMFEAESGTDGRDQYYKDLVITPGSGVTPDNLQTVDDRLTVTNTQGGGFRITGFTADMAGKNKFLTFAIRSRVAGLSEVIIERQSPQDLAEETEVTENTADFDQTTVDIINASAVITTDIDDDGVSTPETDGVLFARYLKGLRGSDLTNGALGADAERTDPADIERFIGETMSYTVQFDGDDYNSLDFNRSGDVSADDATVFSRYVSGESLDADTIRFIEQARANTSFRDEVALAEEIVQTTEDIYDFQSAFDITNAMTGSSGYAAYTTTPNGSVSVYDLENWRRRIKYTEVYYQSHSSDNLLSMAAINNPADFGPAKDELLTLDADSNGISDVLEYGLPDDDLIRRTRRRRLGFHEPMYVQHRDGGGHDFKLTTGHLFESITIDRRVEGNILLGEDFDVYVMRDEEWQFDVTINLKQHGIRDGLLRYDFDEPVERFRIFSRTLNIGESSAVATEAIARTTGFVISKPIGVRGKPKLRIKRLSGRGRSSTPAAIETETPHATEALTEQKSLAREPESVFVHCANDTLDFSIASTTALIIRGNDSADDVLVLDGSGGPLAIPLDYDGGFRNDSIFVQGENIALDFTARDRLKGVELIDYRGDGANSLIIDYNVVRTNNESKTLRVLRNEDDRFIRRGGWSRDGEQVENDIVFQRWVQGDALLLLATVEDSMP